MGSKLSLFLSLILFIAAPALSQGLTVNTARGIDFGDQIFPGIEKKISHKDALAARFEVTGEAGREVQILFQLPNYLQDVSGNTLSIAFSSTDAAYSTDSNGQFAAIAFDPKTGVVTSLSSEGKLYIWLGATVLPLNTQPGNSYSGDIILDVTYTN
ncbi:MAG TPA: hypothetical protein VF181_06050 [Balneolaceae bacterium]